MTLREIFISFLITSAGILITWFLARKKNAAEIRKIEAESELLEIQSVEKAAKIWKDLADELNKDLARLRIHCHALNDEISKMRTEVEELRQENRRLRNETPGVIKN